MNLSYRSKGLLAIIVASSAWGASVPLSKVSLGWLSPTWLTLGRFLVAGLVLAFIGRRRLRSALSPLVAFSGVIGFGVCILLQNVGVQHTSVSHAAVLMGIVPGFVALFGVLFGHGHANRREWLSYAISAGGIVLVADGGGGGASLGGDLLVLASVLLSAGFIAAQPRVLEGRDPVAVTAVQFLAAAASVVPFLFAGSGAGRAVGAPGTGPLLAFIALAIVGTVLPFSLFAWGQALVPPRLAGAVVNLEPVVGAALGWMFFADPCTGLSLAGALAVIGGIVLAATQGPVRLPGFPGDVAAARAGSAIGAAFNSALRDVVAAHEAMLALPGSVLAPRRAAARPPGGMLGPPSGPPAHC